MGRWGLDWRVVSIWIAKSISLTGYMISFIEFNNFFSVILKTIQTNKEKQQLKFSAIKDISFISFYLYLHEFVHFIAKNLINSALLTFCPSDEISLIMALISFWLNPILYFKFMAASSFLLIFSDLSLSIRSNTADKCSSF